MIRNYSDVDNRNNDTLYEVHEFNMYLDDLL